jgi:hypothetical protein
MQEALHTRIRKSPIHPYVASINASTIVVNISWMWSKRHAES